jgi:FtsZ-interacting cell division protein YlmF
MEALSWFKFCPAKWNMGKTKKLSMEEKAEYLDLCSSYWVGGCVMSTDEMREHSDCIDTFIRRGLIGEDGIDWLNAQYEEATRKSEAASKAAKTRWEKKEQSGSNANAMRTHSESNALVMQRREEKSREDREDRKKEGTHLTVVMPWKTNSFSEIWQIWCKFRTSELRKPKYKEMGEQAALKQLSELAGGDEATAHKIIEQSIANGWQGLFQLRNDKTQHNGARQPLDNLNMEDLAQWINQD